MSIRSRATWLGLALAGAGVAAGLRRDQTRPLRRGPTQVPEVSPELPRFPAGFHFGAATSAHQVEGGTTNNNWTRWERELRPDGRTGVLTGEWCGQASEHWERFEDDVERMVALGLDTYRFSVEWSRIEPEPGRFDDAALERYRSWCVTLREAGITPMVTLHHFTEPLWLTDRGGFEQPGATVAFEAFTERVVEALGEYVDWWVTINEPNVYCVLGWLYGEFPPGAKDLGRAATVLYHLMEAHARAYHAIHKRATTSADPAALPAQVSIAQNLAVFEPRSWANPAEVAATRIVHRNYNAAPIHACQTGRLRFGFPGAGVNRRVPGLKGTLDWLGVNHYFRQLVKVPGPDGLPEAGFDRSSLKSQMGWDLLPGTLARAVRWADRYQLPIVVTEHGIADDAQPDRQREWFLQESLAGLSEAIEHDVDVRGYLHWSLMDNFEWAQGFRPRFGLYRVDYDTQERTLTAGGERYRDIIAANRPTPPG